MECEATGHCACPQIAARESRNCLHDSPRCVHRRARPCSAPNTQQEPNLVGSTVYYSPTLTLGPPPLVCGPDRVALQCLPSAGHIPEQTDRGAARRRSYHRGIFSLSPLAALCGSCREAALLDLQTQWSRPCRKILNSSCGASSCGAAASRRFAHDLVRSEQTDRCGMRSRPSTHGNAPCRT